MQLNVLNSKGEQTGRQVTVPEAIFGIEPNEHVVYLAVKHYLAAQRQGTHKVKNRKEVKGSSKKMHKQKGTGGSRKGNIRNPLYKGGGTIFGPKPRDYDFKLNKKVKDLAKLSVLSDKAKKGAIVVVEDMQIEVPKTKTFTAIVRNLKLNDKKILFLLSGQENENVYLSFQNLPKVKGVLLNNVNTYDILHADVLLFCETAAKFFTVEEETESASQN